VRVRVRVRLCGRDTWAPLFTTALVTMSEVSTGVTGTLMSRAAHVVLKERRRLVLAMRETPLHSGHLRTLPGVGRLLDPFDVETDIVRRWKQQ
jgi:flavin prenyltransferase